MSFLGIDFGASFLKSAVLDLDGGALRQVRRVSFPPFLPSPHPERREVDAEALTRALADLLDFHLDRDPEIEGLVFCSQMHGFLLADAKGTALSPYYSWQDGRAEPRFDEMAARLGPEERRALGNEVRPGHPASLLFWLKENGALPAGARVCSLGDFLAAQALGQAPAIEPTHASGLGLYDVLRGDWSAPVLDTLGLPSSLLPELKPSGARLGNLRRRGRTLAVYTPVGDQQCALLGAGLEEGELSLNIATGSQVSRLARDATTGDYQLRPYFDGLRLRTVTHLPAGRSLNALLRLLYEANPQVAEETRWEEILRKVEELPATDAEADLSFFPAAFGSRGRFGNLREGNLTAGHLFLAALASMSRNYREAARRVAPASDWTAVRLSGGLAQKIGRLRALLARDLPGSQVASPFPEETLRGLGILARSWREGIPVAEGARQAAGRFGAPAA